MKKDIRATFIGYEGDTFTQEQLDYAAADVEKLFDLQAIQQNKIVNFDLGEVARLERKFTEVLVDMQKNGIHFDFLTWIRLYNDSKEAQSKAEKYLRGKANISWASPKQVLEALGQLGIKLPDTDSNNIRYYLRDTPKMTKTNRTILERLLEYRLYQKRVSTYGSNIVDSIDPDYRIRGNFNQVIATGRMSSMKPNLQNIPHPPEYRACFMATPGMVMVGADYSSQELVILATMAGEQKWLDEIAQGRDLHSAGAALFLADAWEKATEPGCAFVATGKKCKCPGHIDLRDKSKALNFGIPYGLTPRTYAQRQGISEYESQRLYDQYFTTFPHIDRWLQKAADDGYRTAAAYTMEPFGRWRNFHGYEDYRRKNIGKNTPIQGTAGDMTKLAAIKVYNYIHNNGYPARLLLAVHDELLTETIPELAEEWKGILQNCMEDAAATILGHNLLKAVPWAGEHWTK